MSDTIKHITLKTNDLSIGYQTKRSKTVICEAINFELEQGQLIGLVGANGIGKSTLLRTITKVQSPLHGQVFINAIEQSKISLSELSKAMSLVLTEPIQAKNLSVYELVALGRHPYTNWVGRLTESDKSIIDNALALTSTDDLKHKKCYELSDGQLQRVMIARALAQDTDIIILDEPTTHLDMYHKAHLLKLLKDLTLTTNKTILFSSHEIDLAIQLCDIMMVMTENGIVTNTPYELIKKGTFNSLFPKDLIIFDETTGSFRVRK